MIGSAMKLAIMQPYFFPYIGYYQLAFEVNEFVFFDDVNFIKKGYINRNAILLTENKFDFSIPVSNVSQNRTIAKHEYTGDFSAFLKTVQQAYRKAPNFECIYQLIVNVVSGPGKSVAKINASSLQFVFDYLGIKRHFSYSSEYCVSPDLKGQDRILEICRMSGATDYRNAIGGRDLYDNHRFADKGITLQFIRSGDITYPQPTHLFVPNLSMIDVLMWNEPDQIINMLRRYTLE